MSIVIRAKFQLQEIRQHIGEGKTYIFCPMYDTSIPEDRRFSQYTPTGELRIFVTNPVVHATWHLGRYCYFDVTAIEPSDV